MIMVLAGLPWSRRSCAVDAYDVYILPDGPILSGDLQAAWPLAASTVLMQVGLLISLRPSTQVRARDVPGLVPIVGTVADPPEIPADNQFDTIDNLGFPGNWLIRASGTSVSTVPTLGQWGLGSMLVLLMAAGIYAGRKR